jgi:hypothetical protein
MGCGENAGYRGSYVSLNATELRRFIIIEPVKKPDRRSDRSIVNELRMPRSRERNEGPDNQSYRTLHLRTRALISERCTAGLTGVTGAARDAGARNRRHGADRGAADGRGRPTVVAGRFSNARLPAQSLPGSAFAVSIRALACTSFLRRLRRARAGTTGVDGPASVWAGGRETRVVACRLRGGGPIG